MSSREHGAIIDRHFLPVRNTPWNVYESFAKEASVFGDEIRLRHFFFSPRRLTICAAYRALSDSRRTIGSLKGKAAVSKKGNKKNLNNSSISKHLVSVLTVKKSERNISIFTQFSVIPDDSSDGTSSRATVRDIASPSA